MMSSLRTVNSILNSTNRPTHFNRHIIHLNKQCFLTRSSSTSYKLKFINSQVRTKTDKKPETKKNDLSSHIKPINIKNDEKNQNAGQEIVGRKLNASDVNQILNLFYQRKTTRSICLQNGIDENLLRKGFISFRNYCLETNKLAPELYVIFNDIIEKKLHVDELSTYFLKHCKEVFPHLNCLEELKKISDLRLPIYWYPEARKLNRKIIFHSGPTNSGKTYNALRSFLNAETGVYCGPLKLLAVEVFNKANEQGVTCDLITGEEKILSNKGEPSNHVSSTVEMISTQNVYDVAVIDEIQMVRDSQRGYAWTRALLGLQAKEIHICGESAAINIIQEVLSSIDEKVEVRTYERLSPLQVSSTALESLANVEDGDCIVCFNKAKLFNICLELEKLGKQFAVIYGSLPPSTKLNQAKKFNDPNDPCKILVATDAIGMGLNLSIKRIIFSSMHKTILNSNDEKELELISTSMALQIAGRAGRFKSGSDLGYATTLNKDDLPILKKTLKEVVSPINSLGLFPNAEQLELFAYHLPHATLKELIDIFISVCQVDTSNYFMCNLDAFKQLAELIQHIQLTMGNRYILCTAPVDLNNSFICTMFLKFARAIADNEPMTLDELSKYLQMPFKSPNKIQDLVYLESVFDIFDLYLWLGNRFQLNFPDIDLIKQNQKQLDVLINQGVANIAQLISKDKANKLDLTSKLKRTSARLQNLENLQEIYDSANTDGSGEDLQTGELTKKLLNSGLLTSKMVKQLQREWIKSFRDEMDSKKKS